MPPTTLDLAHAQAAHEATHTNQSHQHLAHVATEAWLNDEIDDAELDEILTEAAQ